MNYRQMRRSLKEVTDQSRIEQFLMKASVGYLGLMDEEGTYVVPLNFVWKDGKIYFHGSEEGRKVDAIKHNKRVCFTVAEDNGIIANPAPANIGTAYFSVMVFGKVKALTNIEEATTALKALLEKNVPGYFDSPLSRTYVDKYRSSLGSRTVVYCITPDQISAKEAATKEEQLFYPGRKQADDLKK